MNMRFGLKEIACNEHNICLHVVCRNAEEVGSGRGKVIRLKRSKKWGRGRKDGKDSENDIRLTIYGTAKHMNKSIRIKCRIK